MKRSQTGSQQDPATIGSLTPTHPPAARHHTLPAVGLFFLAPLVAEFFLGNLPITALYTLVLLAPLYGGGALLIRETARHTGRGWPSMVILGVAFGLLEEGITTMSLFNPNYAGAHLLDYGFIPQLGIAGPWTVGVLTLHTIWSICVPIALIEALASPAETTPWLGRLGLVITAVLFGFGVVANTLVSISLYHFVASVPQLVVTVALIVVLVFGALRFKPSQGRSRADRKATAPSPWLVGLAAFATTSLFKLIPARWNAAAHMLFGSNIDRWNPWLLTGFVLLFEGLAVLLIVHWSRLTNWGSAHKLALAGGALLTYTWSAFPQRPVLPASPSADLVGNVVFALLGVLLLILAGLRLHNESGHTTKQAVSA